MVRPPEGDGRASVRLSRESEGDEGGDDWEVESDGEGDSGGERLLAAGVVSVDGGRRKTRDEDVARIKWAAWRIVEL